MEKDVDMQFSLDFINILPVFVNIVATCNLFLDSAEKVIVKMC